MTESTRRRAGVVLLKDGSLALIRRVRAEHTYFVIPGGGVNAEESIEDAAVREAHEELGLHLRLSGLLAIVRFQKSEQYYFRATVEGGVFGAGMGEEFSSAEWSEAGTYEPVWVPIAELCDVDIRPRCLLPLILNPPSLRSSPPVFEEA